MASATPAENRVSPTGEIIAAPGRGAWMGNRGCLHEGRGSRTVVRQFRTKTWIICDPNFKNRRVPQWEPNRYTVLFFLDEAVAIAAGHRPCAECRRSDYRTYRDLWRSTHCAPQISVADIDHQLHRERTDPDRIQLAWSDIPNGVFVMTVDGPAVVVDEHLSVFDDQTNTYSHKVTRPTQGRATLLTPASSVEILRAGYPAQIDQTAY